jgi:hypothetical protein
MNKIFIAVGDPLKFRAIVRQFIEGQAADFYQTWNLKIKKKSLKPVLAKAKLKSSY